MIKFVNFALFYCYLTNNCIAFDELPALSRPVSIGDPTVANVAMTVATEP